jgi:hypothetical protein
MARPSPDAEPSADVDVPPAGEIIAGRYRVEGLLGIGGMGIVVAAWHVHLGQRVAVKILRRPKDDRHAEAKARFLREARAAAAMIAPEGGTGGQGMGARRAHSAQMGVDDVRAGLQRHGQRLRLDRRPALGRARIASRERAAECAARAARPSCPADRRRWPAARAAERAAPTHERHAPARPALRAARQAAGLAAASGRAPEAAAARRAAAAGRAASRRPRRTAGPPGARVRGRASAGGGRARARGREGVDAAHAAREGHDRGETCGVPEAASPHEHGSVRRAVRAFTASRGPARRGQCPAGQGAAGRGTDGCAPRRARTPASRRSPAGNTQFRVAGRGHCVTLDGRRSRRELRRRIPAGPAREPRGGPSQLG